MKCKGLYLASHTPVSNALLVDSTKDLLFVVLGFFAWFHPEAFCVVSVGKRAVEWKCTEA